jgi:hypothetical protein
VVGPLLIAAYDLAVYVTAGNDATVSRVILDAARNGDFGLLIPFAVGVLVGHLFVPQHLPPEPKP